MPVAKYVSGEDPRLPSGMSTDEYNHMSEVLSQIQGVLGTGVASMESE